MPAADGPPASPAARLLLACTCPPGLAVAQGLAEAAAAGVDWDEFEALVTRHAAAPLVHRALAPLAEAPVPPHLCEALRRQAWVNRMRNLVLLDELARIDAAARAAGLPLVPYKGLVLAQQLHGDIGLRVCSDLDLLTEPAAMERAAAMMAGLGYRFAPLRGQKAGRSARANLRHWHCYNFLQQSPSIAVDLHIRFTPHYFPVRAGLATFADRLVPCSVGPHRLAGFCDTDLLVLLALHAAKDLAWRRLTWHSEIALLLQRLPPAGLAQARALATTLGCRRPLDLAVLLAHRLYRAPGWPTAAPPAEQARLHRLAHAVERRLFQPQVQEPTRLQVHFRIHPALRERLADRWASYASGLVALLDRLRPPPRQPVTGRS